MRKRFPEYFYEPDIKEMWNTAIFVPDTNVLLDVFRFPPASSKGLLKILKHLKSRGRLWIPYQFAHEYLKKQPNIRHDIQKDYDERMGKLKHLSGEVANALRKFDKQTDCELDEQIANIKSIFEEIKEDLQEHRKKHKERLKPEYLEGEIDKLFADRIGAPYNDQELAKIYGEGEWRYKLRRPPGFKDENKPVSRRYGDLIGWLQIIDHARKQGKPKRPVILVTSDSGGDDWFYKLGRNEKTQGPRPELVKEMHDKAKVDFYLYQTGEFMELANKYILKSNNRITAAAIKEARNHTRRASLALDLIHMALRSIQRNVDIIHEELDLIQPLDRSMRDALQPMQSLDTPKMQEALRLIQQDVDMLREELPLIWSPLFMYEVLRSIQQGVDIMRDALLPIQQNPLIIRRGLRSIQQNVDLVREEMLRIQHRYLWTTFPFDKTTSP